MANPNPDQKYALKPNQVIVVMQYGDLMDIKEGPEVKMDIILLKADLLNQRYHCRCELHPEVHGHRKSFTDPSFWVNGQEVRTFDPGYTGTK